MASSAKKPTRAVVAQAATEAANAVLAGGDVVAPAPRGRKRATGDPIVGELRHQLLPLLVLHFIAQGPSYGNQLIDRVAQVTAGVLSVNPNTMYPLLRDLEARELIAGQWEHPERRTRRFYTATAAGEAELVVLRKQSSAALVSLERSLAQIKHELFD